MRSSTVSTAVAGILAVAGFASTANATAINIFISGASAQRTFWEKDLGAICTGTFGTTGVTVQSSALPDIHLDTCTIAGTGRGTTLPTIPSGLASGDVITMQYAAELGSVWGIAPLVSGNAAAAGRRYLDASFCSGTTCTVTGYDRNSDTATSGLTGKVHPDLLVTDMEPTLWDSAHPDNWPTFAILQPQPTAAALSAVGAYTRVNGQVFGLYVNTANPATASLIGSGNGLSANSAYALLAGQYTTWDQVPELHGVAAAAGVNVALCRRDHGSGTEVATSVTFARTECGANGSPIASVANTNNLAVTPIEVASSADMATCLTTTGNASGEAPIGIRSIASVSGASLINLNGIEANAHNAASGAYPYAYDTFVKNVSATTQPGTKAVTLVGALVTDAGTPTRLPAEAGTFTGPAETFVVTGGVANAQAAYGLDNGSVSLASDWAITTGKAPREVFTQGGNSCAARNNDNLP